MKRSALLRLTVSVAGSAAIAAPNSDRGIDRAPDQLRRHQRTRRIVNHHDVRIARHRGERVGDGILSPLAAFDDLHRLGPLRR